MRLCYNTYTLRFVQWIHCAVVLLVGCPCTGTPWSCVLVPKTAKTVKQQTLHTSTPSPLCKKLYVLLNGLVLMSCELRFSCNNWYSSGVNLMWNSNTSGSSGPSKFGSCITRFLSSAFFSQSYIGFTLGLLVSLVCTKFFFSLVVWDFTEEVALVGWAMGVTDLAR